MNTAEAVKQLVSALKNDSGYYYSWQANIAMAFKDEMSREGITFPQLHSVANKAAINFLDILMKDVNTDETTLLR
jgi:hypothetical protein